MTNGKPAQNSHAARNSKIHRLSRRRKHLSTEKAAETGSKKNSFPNNPMNNKHVYPNERLPAIENMIKNYIEEKTL